MKILAELGYPPIFIVSPEQFWSLENNSIKGCDGISGNNNPIISIRAGLRGKAKENTLYHEFGHILFPSKPHWWIDNFGEVMARGGGRGHWAKKYNKPVEDMPSRSHLLRLAQLSSQRMRKKRKSLIKI